MTVRDHEPILIEDFMGLWRRGDPESTPMDHFVDCDNLMYGDGFCRTRDGMDIELAGESDSTIPNVVRMYTYVYRSTQGLLVLDSAGNIFHTGSPTPTIAILSIPGMTDFAFVSVADRAYISPSDGVTGLENEFLYVYKGDGTPARKAAGFAPVGATFAAGNGLPDGKVERGYHVFGVVYETDTGFLTRIGPDPLAFYNAPGGIHTELTGIPTSPDSFVVARHIVATKAIPEGSWLGDTHAAEFFFVPDGRIADNTTTTFVVDFYDADLLKSADPLLDLFEEIPAFVALNTYHNRLVGVAEFGDPTDDDEFGLISTARISLVGQPEAIDEVEGLIVAPLEGNPLTNAQEYRDVLYLFKNNRIYAYNDNGDVPSSWPLSIIDQGVGASIHGIATVLDSGGINIEYLIIAGINGIFLFNGAVIYPELSWKILDFWKELDKTQFKYLQIVNDTKSRYLYIVLPNFKMLFGDYDDSMSHKAIKWSPWRFDIKVNTVALLNLNEVILGSSGELE